MSDNLFDMSNKLTLALREIRLRKNWTVQRLADEFGVNRSTCFGWLCGRLPHRQEHRNRIKSLHEDLRRTPRDLTEVCLYNKEYPLLDEQADRQSPNRIDGSDKDQKVAIPYDGPLETIELRFNGKAYGLLRFRLGPRTWVSDSKRQYKGGI